MELNQDQLDEVANEVFDNNDQEAEDSNDLDIDGVADQFRDDQVSALRRSAFVASKRNPDQFARVNKIAEKFKTAPHVVEGSEADFEEASKIGDFDYDGILNSNPKLVEFYKDPDNASLAFDDVENLKGIAEHFNEKKESSDFYNAFKSGLARANASFYKIPALAYDAAAFPQNLFYKAIGSEKRVVSPEWSRDNALTQRYEGAANQLQAEVPDLDESVLGLIETGNYSKAGRALALQITSNAPQQISNLGFALTNPTVGLSYIMASSAADKNDQNLEKGVDPAIGTPNALLSGGAEAIFESVGTFGILDKWGASLAKTYGKETAKEIIKQTSKAMAASIIGEGNEEALTQIAQGMADKHMGISPDLTYSEIFRQAADAGLVGMGAGFSMTGPTVITEGAFQIRESIQQDADLNFYRKLGDLAKNSKLKERAPERFKNMVEGLTEGTDVKTVYMPVEGVEEYFQSKGIAPIEFMKQSGLLEQYENAKETGGNIEVPLSTWTEKIGSTEHFRGLENHIKFNQSNMTKAESIREQGKMKRLFAEIEAEAQANLEDPAKKADQEKIEGELEQIKSQFKAQLEATGLYSKQVINDQVDLMAGPLRYFAKANSKTPMQLWNEMNLKVQNGGEYSKVQEIADQIGSEVDLFANSQKEGIPEFDSKGGRVYDNTVVDLLRSSIEKGEAGKRGAKVDERGEAGGVWSSESSFPDFFQNKGYKKADVLKAIDKFKAGEKLTENQQAIFDDLYSGALGKVNRKEYFQFGGQKSKNAPIIKLQTANSLKESGKDMDSIRKETGWFMGPDNRWRYEISDENAKLKQFDINKKKKFKLKDILEHEELFQAYPEIGDIDIVFGAHRGLKGGHFDKVKNEIKINVHKIEVLNANQLKAMDRLKEIKESPEFKEYLAVTEKKDIDENQKAWEKWKQSALYSEYNSLVFMLHGMKKETTFPKDLGPGPLSTLLHEIQHGIQKIEGFATGANKKSAGGYNNYFNTLGEVEARNVEARRQLSDQQRQEQAPDVLTWKNPIINWGNVAEELPIKSPEEIKPVVFGEQMKLFQSQANKLQMSFNEPSEVEIYKNDSPLLNVEDAKSYFKDKIQGTSVVNNQTGWKIDFSSGGKKKSQTTIASPENRFAHVNIDNLMKNAIYWNSEPDRRGRDSEIKANHRFYAPFELSGKEYIVSITVDETKDGKKFYSKFALENEKPVNNELPDQTGAPLTGRTVSIEQFKENVKVLKIKDPFFQDQNSPRANVIFDKYGISVNLFKGADPTSVIHEMGHVYLELFKKSLNSDQAPEWLKADAEKVLKFIGAESFDDIKVEHHERWAEAVEKYMYEGKAPSDELSAPFSRMKMWFRSIYNGIKKSLDIEINDEVREVMDRMFAGDELLSKAESQYKPLFDDASSVDLTPEVEKRLNKSLEKFRAKAHQSVTEKIMESHLRARRIWYIREVKKISQIMRDDLAKRREYVAQEFLKTGKFPNSLEAFPENAHKISEASLKESIGSIPKWAKPFVAKEGADLKYLSDLLGFQNPQDLLSQLEKTEDIDVLAKRLAEDQIKSEYGDIFSDTEKLREEVEKAVHNEHRAEVLSAELEYLASEDLATLKGLIRKISRRPPKDEVVKARAVKLIASKKIEEIKPYYFQNAERKAAAEAADYFAKGDFEKAFDSKQRELLNFYLYREAVRAKELIENKTQWAKKVFEGKTEDVAERRDFSMVSLARVLLGEYGVVDRDFSSAHDYLDKLSQYDEDTYEGLKPLVEKWLVGKKDFKKMSMDDFAEFMQDIEAIWSLARSSREIEINGQKYDLDEISEKMKARLAEITTKPYAPGLEKAVTDSERRLDKFMSFKSSLQRVEAWVDLADSGDQAKIFESFMLNPVREVITGYKLKKKELFKKYKELVEKLPKETVNFKDIAASEINYTFKDKAELLAALLHTGNDSNLFKLLAGRKWGDVDLETGTVDPSRWNRFIDRLHQEKILTQSDWDFVQGVWDLNESIKPDAQRAHKDMYGHFFDEVTAKKFMTPFGEYKGGYMPAVTDPFLVEDQRIRQEQDALLNNNNSFMFPTTGRGFTKSRVQKYNAPLLLDMNMVGSHFDKVLRFTYIEPTIKKIAKLNNKKDYRELLRAYDPYAGSNLINPWLQRAAQQRVVQPSQTSTFQKFDGVAKFIRASAGLQILGLNLSNAMQQLTGTVVASSKVNPKYLAKAISTYALEPNATKEEVMKLSPWMETRLDDGLIKISDDINKILFNPSKYEQVADYAQKNGMVLSEMFQHVVDVTVWQGAYMEALDQGMPKEQAIKRADKEVRMTQGSASAEDISSIEEGTHWSRLFTQFYGYFNMQGNLIGTETAKKVRSIGWKQALPTLLPFYLSSYLLPGLAAQSIAQMMSGKDWDSDDDDSIIDDLGWMTLTSMYKGIFAMFPLIGQTANMIIGQFTNERYDDRLSMSPAIAAIENVGKTAFVTYKKASGEELKGHEIRSMMNTLGFVTGIPIGPIGRPVQYLTDVNDGKTKPEGPIDFARGLATGQSQK